MEGAILTMRDHDREALKQSNQSKVESQALELLRSHPERLLDQVLLVGSVTNLMLAATALFIVREQHPFGMRVLPAALILFVLILIVTDVLPKAFALNRPRSVFLSTAPLAVGIESGLGRITRSLESFSDKLASAITPDSLKPNPALVEEELETLVDMQLEEGALSEEEHDVIREILRLSDRDARDCMTPRTDAFLLSDELSKEEADQMIKSQHHWRIPVYHGQPDSIVGVVDVRSYLWDDRDDADFRDHMAAPVFVPESMDALRLFEQHLIDPFSMVVVLDEYGGFEGIVAAADMLEELIEDAAPSNFSSFEIQEVSADTYVVSGTARLDELGELLDMDLEHEGLDTIGGLVFTLLGELPKRGALIELSDGVRAIVRRCAKNRIEELLIERKKGARE